MRKRLSFANITSVLALFLALSTGAYAAITLPANSVGSRQLKANAVTARKLAPRAVTSDKIAANAVRGGNIAAGAVSGSQVVPGSLTGANINVATLGKVPSAATADSAGVARVKTVTTTSTAVPNATTTATATCDPGLTVVGGGASLSNEDNQLVNDTYPSGTNGWTVHVFASTSGAGAFTVYAICVPAASTS
jgi:hypothetical protein